MLRKASAAPQPRGSRIMDEQDAREFAAAAEIQTRKITKNAATARAFLVRAGFLTPKLGKLTARYGGRDKN